MEVNGLHSGNSVNDATKKHLNTHSTFNLERNRLQTMRFGEYTPHFVLETVPDDKIILNSHHNVRSYTLKAPLLSGVSMKKDYFNVPMEAIQPNAWELIYVNPVQGDDVPSDASFYVNLSKIGSTLNSWLSSLLSTAEDLAGDDELLTESLLRWIVLNEYFLSSGSLLRQLGYGLSDLFHYTLIDSSLSIKNEFDYVAERLLEVIRSNYPSFGVTIGDESFTVDSSILVSQSGRISWHDFLQRIRENPVFSVDVWTPKSGNPIYTAVMNILDNCEISVVVTGTDGDIPISMYRPAAYQVVCHHFYSNDHIDYVYSANLFRQLMGNYGRILADFNTLSFEYNSLSVQYDWLSRRYLDLAFSSVLLDDVSDEFSAAALDYLSSLLSFRRSLRYVDYFTGAKSQPLAVGDTSVSVNDNAVSVIDVTKKIAVQRFLNNVNRTGRKLYQYVKDLFGITPAYDYHDPAFLAHTADTISAIENENTAEAQFTEANSVSSVFRSNAERYSFEFVADRPSVLIGVTYFDIPRAYAVSNDRPIFFANRFDSFIKDLQFIGDQDIKQFELGRIGNDSMPPASPFAYTLRDMQYKQLFDIACGGFVDDLPAWSFIAPIYDDQSQQNINPSFIRSSNYELDVLYVSLTGNVLSKYFHFVVVNTNRIQAKRPMAYAPSIL